MNKYDLVSIVRPTADDTVVESVHKSIADVISSGGGSISEQGIWQKRKLAYESPSDVPAELDRVLKISDDVIRHKVLKMES